MLNDVPNEIETPIFMYADIENPATSQEILENIAGCRPGPNSTNCG